jgi:hypothetical protein
MCKSWWALPCQQTIRLTGRCALRRELKSKAQNELRLNRQLRARKITAERTSRQPALGATAIVFGVASIIIHAYAFQALPLRANLGTAVTD